MITVGDGDVGSVVVDGHGVEVVSVLADERDQLATAVGGLAGLAALLVHHAEAGRQDLEHFEPADKEHELHLGVSAFFQRQDTILFGDRNNPLVLMG